MSISVVCMSRSTWAIVGMINGHGFECQNKDAISDAHGPFQSIRSTLKRVFCRFWLIGCAYELLRELKSRYGDFCGNKQTTDKTNCFTPVHVLGNYRKCKELCLEMSYFHDHHKIWPFSNCGCLTFCTVGVSLLINLYWLYDDAIHYRFLW